MSNCINYKPQIQRTIHTALGMAILLGIALTLIMAPATAGTMSCIAPDGTNLAANSTVYVGETLTCSWSGGSTSYTTQVQFEYSKGSCQNRHTICNFNQTVSGTGSCYIPSTYSGPGYGVLAVVADHGGITFCQNNRQLNYYRDTGTRPPIYPPVTNFSATPVILFTDMSSNYPTSWFWDFGDGSTSTLQNPQHTYQSPGTYTILHSATNSRGTSWKNNTAYIVTTYNPVSNLIPIVDFIALLTNGPAPLNVTFTDTSANTPTNWSWSFGDGNTSTGQNPSHIYETAGTYDVSLTAANAAGSNATVRAGYVTVTGTCPYACDATLTHSPYIDFGIDNVTFPNDSGVWRRANCYDNALIRWAMAGESSSFHTTLLPWMWKRNPCCPNPGYSYAVDMPANKPIYIAAVENPDADVVFHHHAVDAELLTAENARNSTWESWNFFNYHELNISRGWNQQIPNGTSSFWTEVGIEWINELPGEGQYRGDTQITFYIAPNSSVYLHPRNYYTESYAKNQADLTDLKTQKVPDEIHNEIITMKSDRLFTINNWEFDPIENELVVYAHDIKHENSINNAEGRFVGNYSVRIVHDTEFEEIREDVEQQLVDLRQNSDYQISWIGMVTDTNGDVPKKTVELWVDKSTPENKKLDNTIIQGWTIHVYPISRK